MNNKLTTLFDLTGKTALVTGGGSGMGGEFTRILSEAGATVMIAARNEERLKETARLISGDTGNPVHVCKVDLSNRQAAEDLVVHAQTTMGGLDILVANAAVDIFSTTEVFDADLYDDMFAVNFTSNVWMTKAAVPNMKKNKWGRIIYISSISSQMGLLNLNMGLYAASKSALEAYARHVAAEMGTHGITVNCLLPGGVKTPMHADSPSYGDVTDEQRQQTNAYIDSLIPLNRFAEPHELAGTLLLLASDAGSYITGARYIVDGGWTSLGDTVT